MPLFEEMKTLLAEERNALRAGEIYRLRGLTSQKEAMAASLAQGGASIPEDDVRALRAEASRNARLIEAAQNGLNAAMARLSERRRVASRLEIYGADGRRSEVYSTGPRHSHRA